MNEFTKEELKFIAIALERFAVKDCELDKKIQSMIESHCEHEKSNPSLVMAIVCIKCDKPLENGKWCK